RRGRTEPTELHAGDRAAHGKLADRSRGERTASRIALDKLLEQIVERPDPTGKQDGGSCEKIALNPVDVRPVRHDEPRIRFDRCQESVQQQRDLSRMRGTDDERKRHLPIVVSGSDASSYAQPATSARCGKRPASK